MKGWNSCCVMKPKLLVVTSTFPRWENDTDPPFVYELSRRLTGSFDVTVHAPHYPGSLTKGIMSGVHVHRFRYFWEPYERLAGGQGIVPKLRRNKFYSLLLPFFLTAQFCSLFLLVRKIRPDIIHAHWMIPQGFWAVLVKKLFKIPVIITAHGADVFSLRTPIVIIAKKWIVGNADRIVTVSAALAEVLRTDTHITHRPAIIPMGVDSALFSPENKKEAVREQYGIHGPFLLFVGRLTEKKGVQYLIEAMSKVTSKYPDAKLLIIGHGELEKALLKQVEQLGLEKEVIFAGGVANAQLPFYYGTSDIFIGPSVQVTGGDTEGFGLTFVEAALCGCLVIGTRIGGIEDIIQDGKTGYLAEPENVQDLADTITSVLKNLDSVALIRDSGRKEAKKKFDWKIVVEKYKNILLRLI